MMHATGFGRVAALCAVLLLAGCGSNSGDGNSQGMATVRVGLGTTVPKAVGARAVAGSSAGDLAGVTAVNLTVSAADMATVSVALPLDGSTVTLSIPAGLNRVFSASAHDAGNTLTHSGTTTVAQLVAGMQTSVSLALNAVIPDTTAPAVQSTTPANAATGIATGATIRIVFSEAMNAATVNGANLTVMAPGAVSGSVSYDTATNSALFTPATALPAGTVVNVGLAAALTDVAGNALSGAPYSFSFTTAAAAPTDTTPPTVLSTLPANGATGVSTGATISVTFSEAVDCATLSAASFGVSGGAAVAGTVGCSVDTATFTPSASLAGGTAYTATVTTSVRDVAGNALAGNYTWSFTTQPSSGDAVAPTFNGLKIAVPSAAGGNVTLAWDTATDNVTASNAIVYDISVATVAGAPFSATYTTAAGTTSYTVGGLTAHIDYYFVVRARDQAGNSDANTVEAVTHELMGSMQLRGTPLPAQPGGVQFTYFDACTAHTLDFGDGSSYTGNCIADNGNVTVSHQYATAGTYTVRVTESPSGFNEYITLTITSAAGAGASIPELTISAGATSGGTWSGGNPDIFTPNSPGATVLVTDIESRLNAGKSVTITTSPTVGGNGDIYINNAVSWSANALALTAERDIRINAVMTASGSSALLMNTASAVAGGTVKTGLSAGSFIGRVDFPGRSGAGFLTINGNGYTVINTLGVEGSVTTTDLQGMSGNLAGYYALGGNLDASATSGWNAGPGFAPVGNLATKFTGAFDGLGHTITGFWINRTAAAEFVGLFGYTGAGSAVRNVGMVNGSVTGGWNVGGLIGANDGGFISNSYSASGNVSGLGVGHIAAGLVGLNNVGGIISNCYATGSVSGYRYVGGLVGHNLNGSTITDSYSTGSAYAIQHFVGGLAGYNESSTISNSYATGNMTASGDNVGGLVGINLNGTIINSYATGSATSQFGAFAGGLVGQASSGAITNSYSTGTVSSGAAIYFGGLLGFNTGSTITNSYWDTQTSGQATSPGGIGLTTAQMKSQASFAGWDFTNTWRIDEGVSYPTLQAFWVPPAAVNTWTGLVDNSWTTVGNWSLWHVPTAAETVNIPVVAATAFVQMTGGTYTVKNITSAEPFVLSGAGTSFTLTQGGAFNAGLTLGANTSLASQGTLSLSSYTLGAGAKIDLTQSGTGLLTIGGVPYTVINNLGAAGSMTGTDLQGMNGNLAGNYALGSHINASLTSGWNAGAGFAPVGTGGAFSGRFDGLGHTITGLMINRPAEDNVGFFGFVGYAAADIRNIGLVNVTVIGGRTSAFSNNSTGGLVGTLGAITTSTVSNSYCTGSVSGIDFVGGLVGRNNVGTIIGSHSAASVTGSGSYTGGLAGSSASSISNSYSTGNVAGALYVGGLVAENNGPLSNSYSTSNVSSSFNFNVNKVGGLVASNWVIITNCYSTGSVSAGAAVTKIGGFAGENVAGWGTISNSYWDTSTSGMLAGIGAGNLTGATGLATAGMKAQASFTGWDFANTWSIVEGVTYPTLRGF